MTKKQQLCKSTAIQNNNKAHKSYFAAAPNIIRPKVSIKSSLKYCWWLLVTGSPHSHAWQWSFMARDLIQDFCSSANTVAMGTKEQLPYNWINIRLLLRHSTLCWEVIHIPPRAPSTCPWICMLLVMNTRSPYNVCGVAICCWLSGESDMVYIKALIFFHTTGPLRMRSHWWDLRCNRDT